MSDVLSMSVAIAIVILAGGLLVWAFRAPSQSRYARARTRSTETGASGASGGMLGAVDEIFHPSAYEASLVWEAQQELPVPAPDSAPDFDELDRGRVRIVLSPDPAHRDRR